VKNIHNEEIHEFNSSPNTRYYSGDEIRDDEMGEHVACIQNTSANRALGTLIGPQETVWTFSENKNNFFPCWDAKTGPSGP
jgi:hypothetical protein